MANRLADAISPYLRSHADNPVEWWPWGAAAFAEAERRDVPVLVSIGYSTCHWCHVMARESFSDPIVAAYLNDNFVAIKVDREEHPDVDVAYMAAAGAFTRNLGWPLNVATTPGGAPFFAGSYFPPRSSPGQPEFLSVLGAVVDAWTERRAGVDAGAEALVEALHAASEASLAPAAAHGEPLGEGALTAVVAELLTLEDEPYGGFGTAPKFPMAPLLGFLLETSGEGRELGLRTLKRMGASPLRDPVEGGFFRYATGRDWSEPHYERMLADNALLLDAATSAWRAAPAANRWAHALMEGVAGFLLNTMRLPGEGFASAQDSESIIEGRRIEGAYYRRDAAARAEVARPGLDEKVVTGWNGLAIGALARAGSIAERDDWVAHAREAADELLAVHLDGAHDRLVRASLRGRRSDAPATLEDYGMLAGGLLQLALASGEAGYAVQARDLVDATLTAAVAAPTAHGAGVPFAVPGGADSTLEAHGMALTLDISEGASPSGHTAIASAADQLFLLGGGERFRVAAKTMAAIMAPPALERPIAYGGALGLLARLSAPLVQLVVVVPDSGAARDENLLRRARGAAASVVAMVTAAQAGAFAAAGFELFHAKSAHEARAMAYLCRDFSCRLPTSDADELHAELGELAGRARRHCRSGRAGSTPLR